MKLKETEKAYVAGFIDGDGCITIQSHPRFLLTIRITNSSKKVMTWLGQLLDTKVFTYEYPDNPKYSTMYALNVNGKFAQELIAQIKPYLVVKSNQAEVALEYPIRNEYAHSRSLSEEDELKQALCAVKMRHLNRKGKKENGGSFDAE